MYSHLPIISILSSPHSNYTIIPHNHYKENRIWCVNLVITHGELCIVSWWTSVDILCQFWHCNLYLCYLFLCVWKTLEQDWVQALEFLHNNLHNFAANSHLETWIIVEDLKLSRHLGWMLVQHGWSMEPCVSGAEYHILKIELSQGVRQHVTQCKQEINKLGEAIRQEWCAAVSILSSCRGSRWSAGHPDASVPGPQLPWSAAGPQVLSHEIACGQQMSVHIKAIWHRYTVAGCGQHVLHCPQIVLSSAPTRHFIKHCTQYRWTCKLLGSHLLSVDRLDLLWMAQQPWLYCLLKSKSLVPVGFTLTIEDHLFWTSNADSI